MTQRSAADSTARPGNQTPGDTPSAAAPGANQAILRALGGLWTHKLDAGRALTAPLLIRWAVDSGIAGENSSVIVQAVVGLLGVVLVGGPFTFAQVYLAERASQEIADDLRQGLIGKLERLSFSYCGQARTSWSWPT